MARFFTHSRKQTCQYAGKIALLALNVVWFAVVVPGHERGMIAMPGSIPSSEERGIAQDRHAATPSACGKSAGQSGADGAKDGCCKNKSSSNCAVCQYFLVTLPMPTLAITVVPGLELLCPNSSHVSRSNPQLPFAAMYLPRGPPGASPATAGSLPKFVLFA